MAQWSLLFFQSQNLTSSKLEIPKQSTDQIAEWHGLKIWIWVWIPVQNVRGNSLTLQLRAKMKKIDLNYFLKLSLVYFLEICSKLNGLKDTATLLVINLYEGRDFDTLRFSDITIMGHLCSTFMKDYGNKMFKYLILSSPSPKS